jgi:hypothetical protein
VVGWREGGGGEEEEEKEEVCRLREEGRRGGVHTMRGVGRRGVRGRGLVVQNEGGGETLS